MKLLIAAFLAATLTLPAAEPAAQWWKGNLHTHSMWSDGDDFPEMIADWYKAHDYHFLALTDHNVLSDSERWISVVKSKGGEAALAKYVTRFGEAWVERRPSETGGQVRLKMLGEFRGKLEEPGRFLMIQSEEITAKNVHINATNIREVILPYSGPAVETSESIVASMRRTVGLVLEQRKRLGVPMFPHINHPNFKWAITAEELLQVEGERFFEVYNGHPLVHNEGDELHAGAERVWDILLTERAAKGGEPFYGLGTDDSHHYHGEPKKDSHPGRGWVVVRAPQLTPEAIVAAMEAGDFYASSGVSLKDVRRSAEGLAVEVAPVDGVTFTIEFIGTRRGYDRTSKPVTDDAGTILRATQRYSKDLGAVLATQTGNSAVYKFRGDELYVRARITSSKLKLDPPTPGEFERAWTQPHFPAAKK